MKVYTGTGWNNAGSSVNGIENSVEHSATAGQTSFTATYDAGFLQVFLNGIRLDASDYTATDGSNVILDTGATVGDTLFIHSFGTFILADHYTKTASDARYMDINAETLPSQTGHSGKYLNTDGSSASWTNVDALPTQTGNAGKYLTTDATNPSWETLDTDANSTTKFGYEHANVVSSDYTIGTNNNMVSAGEITINSGISVTVPSTSTWTIV